MHFPNVISTLRSVVPMLALGGIWAADPPNSSEAVPRVVAQVLVGVAGFEPGVAAEWLLTDPGLLIRPEVFLSEDRHAGFGASISWVITAFSLPERHAFTVGPRIVYHNSDDHGWEADLMAMWLFDLVPSQRGRHQLSVIAAAGAVEDKEGSTNQTEFGASAGIGYGFKF